MTGVSSVVHIVGCLGCMMYDRCVSSVVHIVGCLGCMMYDRCVSLVVHIVCVEGITHVAVSTLWAVCGVYDV